MAFKHMRLLKYKVAIAHGARTGTVRKAWADGQNRRAVEGERPLQKHRRQEDESLSQRLREVQAVQGQEGQESRDQQGLFRSQEGRQSVDSIRI